MMQKYLLQDDSSPESHNQEPQTNVENQFDDDCESSDKESYIDDQIEEEDNVPTLLIKPWRDVGNDPWSEKVFSVYLHLTYIGSSKVMSTIKGSPSATN